MVLDLYQVKIYCGLLCVAYLFKEMFIYVYYKLK